MFPFVVGSIILLVLAVLVMVGLVRVCIAIWRSVEKSLASPDDESAKSSPHPERCPVCDALILSTSGSCSICNWPRSNATSNGNKIAFAILRYHIARMVRSGLIDSDTSHALMQAILKTLGLEPSQTPSPAPSPAPTEVAPQPVDPSAAVTPDISQTPDLAPPTPPAAPAPPRESHMPTRMPSQAPRYAPPPQPLEPAPPPNPVEPARPLSDILVSFLEEKNIRWGELIGGLLIIGSSIALVVSFWSDIEARPILKYGLFNGVAIALFALGHYIHRHWKLATTSQGLLIIATLLVPLNALATAAFLSNEPSLGIARLLSEIAPALIFACLIYITAQVITPGFQIALTITIIGCSLSQYLISRQASAQISESSIWMLGTLVALLYAVPITVSVLRSQRSESMTLQTLVSHLKLLGLGTFAALLATGLLAARSNHLAEHFSSMSPLLPLLGWPSLFTGLVIWQRARDESLTAWRTAGTAVAAFGAIISTGAIALAWPDPALIVTIAVTNFLLLSLASWRFDLPAGHALAASSLAVAYVITLFVLRDLIGWREQDGHRLFTALMHKGNGLWLLPLTVVLGIGAALWQRFSRKIEAISYGSVAGVVAVASVVLALVTGLGRTDDGHAWLVLVIYASAALAAGVLLRHAAPTWVGSVLALLAIVQSITYRFAPELQLTHPLLVSVLIHSGAAMVAAMLARQREPLLAPVSQPLEYSAAFTSLLSALGVLALLPGTSPTSSLWPYAVALCAIWCLAAFVRISRFYFIAFQLSLYGVLLLGVCRLLEPRAWYQQLDLKWSDPWSLQSYGLAFAGLGLLWVLGRHAVKQKFSSSARLSLLTSSQRTVDVYANRLTWLLLGLLCLFAVLRGVEVELLDPTFLLHKPSASISIAIEHARTGGAWWLWAASLVLLLARCTEGLLRRRVELLILLLALVCPLLAAANTDATASAWRWYAGVFLVLLTMPYVLRGSLRSALKSAGLNTSELEHAHDSPTFAPLILVLGGLPIIAASLPMLLGWLPALQNPSATHWLLRLDPLVSYLVPMGVLFACIVAMAIRDRSSKFGLLAGLVLHGAATLGYVIWFRQHPDRLHSAFLIDWPRLNALVGGAYVLAWLGYVLWDARRHGLKFTQIKISPHFLAQQNLAIILAVAYAFLLTGILWMAPKTYTNNPAFVGVLGWLAWVTICGVVLCPEYLLHNRVQVARTACLLLAAGVMLSLELAQATNDPWFGIHVWQITQVLTALLGFGVASRYWQQELHRVYAVIGVIVALMIATAIRTMIDDPQAPWWAFGQLLAASAILTTLAGAARLRGLIYLAGLLISVAVMHAVAMRETELGSWNDWTLWLILSLAIPNAFWVWHDQRWIAPPQDDQLHAPLTPPWHAAAAFLSIAFLVIWLVNVAVFKQLVTEPQVLAWITWTLVLIALLATSWDRRMRMLPLLLHFVGLLGVALVSMQLTQFDPMGMGGNLWDRMIAISIVALGVFLPLSSLAWRWRQEIITAIKRAGVPLETPQVLHDWQILVHLNGALGFVVMIGALACDFHFDPLHWRLLTSSAALLQLLSLGLLAHRSEREDLYRATLLIGAIGALTCAWAWQPDSMTLWHLDRIVAGILACFGSLALLGLGVTKFPQRDPGWPRAAAWITPGLLSVVVLGTLAVMGLEISQQLADKHVAISTWSTYSMIGVIAGLVVLAMTAALVPGRDPLKLSERGRTGYVYAAEVLMGLLYLHVRMTLPWLFHGVMEKYWPLIVMVIAFGGATASEIFRRQNRLVLYEPFERSAALLPVLPVLGFWIAGSEVHYSWTMLIVGAFYGLMAIRRHSFGYSILATLAANGALWYFLGKFEGYSITEHPQIWLIPPAVCVLIAAQLNRDRLKPQQLTAIRYMTSSIIYVSSTADIMLRGVQGALWLPMVLAGLAIAGMLLGIALRVRAFLFLGGTFLVIALGSMIKYAAMDLHQTWIWYVTGIVTGILIIALFAVFEKKRNDILKLVENLRQWEG